jgi:phosphonate transport system substrate-binding protein
MPIAAIRSLALLPTLLCSLSMANAAHADEPLSFGVVPQQAAAQLAAVWSPIFRALSERSGIEIGFRTAPDIPTFEQRLAAGQYDLAYMNPYHYTVFNEQPGYLAFAKQRDKRIRGILVARADTGLTGIQDLDGATLAFPAPAAFAASVLPRAALKEAGIAFEPRYVRSHDSVYRTVAQGLYPAGGGIERTFGNTAPEVRGELKVLWRTKGFTPHAFAAHPRVDAEAVSRLRDAMVAMAGDAEGQVLLASIGFTGIEPATDADWDDVRALEIDLLNNETETAE